MNNDLMTNTMTYNEKRITIKMIEVWLLLIRAYLITRRLVSFEGSY